MLVTIAGKFSLSFSGLCLAAGLALVAAPVAAQQIETIDPDLVIDGDLSGQNSTPQPQPLPQSQPLPPVNDSTTVPASRYGEEALDLPSGAAPTSTEAQVLPAADSTTYAEDDLIGAAEGLFGKGAEGLGRLIEGILEDQGEPSGYIVGREGGGAFILGVRYGSGTLFHKVEGNMPVYWTGPSIGIDAGANAGNTFVLVYNLLDSEDLYNRFPAGEGQAYFVGGFNASYVRRGDIVLIPIRVGAGLRLGVNAGYLKFSREQKWVPF
jgi:hypothetical protein